MKFKTFALTTLLIFSFIHIAQSQKEKANCKVLMEKISGTYEGACKKGLAHGRGIAKGDDTYTGKFRKGLPDGLGLYTYKNGDSFFGLWRNGKKHGQGEIKYKKTGTKDSIVKGTWVDDYLVKSDVKPVGYTVILSRSIDHYNITNSNIEENRIEISFEKAMRKFLPVNLHVRATSGARTPFPSKIIYADVKYPFTCAIEYSIKYGQTIIPVSFTFSIIEKGKWEVRLSHF